MYDLHGQGRHTNVSILEIRDMYKNMLLVPQLVAVLTCLSPYSMQKIISTEESEA